MSAPDTNIEKQKKRHFGPLIGMGAAAVFAGVLLLTFIGWVFSQADEGPVAEPPAAVANDS